MATKNLLSLGFSDLCRLDRGDHLGRLEKGRIAAIEHPAGANFAEKKFGCRWFRLVGDIEVNIRVALHRLDALFALILSKNGMSKQELDLRETPRDASDRGWVSPAIRCRMHQNQGRLAAQCVQDAVEH